MRATPAELRVWELVSQGLASKEIAIRLECKEATVKVHILHLLRAFGYTNRTQLALHWHGVEFEGRKA